MNKVTARARYIWDNIISTVVLINAIIRTGRKMEGLQQKTIKIMNSSEMLRRIFGTDANSAAFTSANIIILPVWKNNVPEVVRRFVEYHEIGHVVLKHFVYGGMDVPTMLEYRNNQIMQGLILMEEAEADRYAALHTTVGQSLVALAWLRDNWGITEVVRKEIQARIDYLSVVGTAGMMLA